MKISIYLFLACALSAQPQKAKPAPKTKPKPAPVTVATLTPEAPPPPAKGYILNDRQTILVHTKVRFDTWIILPAGEFITEAGAGDPENWSIKAADEKHPTNLVHVKPAEPNTRTNLHLRTSSGHIYSFLLTEVSQCADCQPDLKIFVDPPPEPIRLAFGGPPGEEQGKKIIELQQRVAALRREATQAKSDAKAATAKETAAYRAAYPAALRCDYTYKFNRAPFFVEAICSDGLFTYIKSGAEEMPSLYMEKDGKPALVKFDFRTGRQPHHGTYIIDSVMTRGYLQLGKRKLKFQTRS